MEHTLEFKRLRDIHAVCSCGRWTFSGASFDHESDFQIQSRVEDKHYIHRQAVKLLEKREKEKHEKLSDKSILDRIQQVVEYPEYYDFVWLRGEIEKLLESRVR